MRRPNNATARYPQGRILTNVDRVYFACLSTRRTGLIPKTPLFQFVATNGSNE